MLNTHLKIMCIFVKYSSLAANISETVRDRPIHSHNGILIRTYTRPTQGCHILSFRMTLSDLAKYWMTRSIARPVCDSWTTCWYVYRIGLAIDAVLCRFCAFSQSAVWTPPGGPAG